MDSIVLPLLIIAVLIVLNGVYVAAEFAIVGAPRLAIERRARDGERLAGVVHRILEQPREQDRFIATAQLGITLASLGLGMYGEHVLAGWFAAALEDWGASRWIAAHTVATVVSVMVLTYFHIVIGEMVPKSLALQRAERTVLWITPPMLWTKRLLYPLVIGLNAAGNGVLRLLGLDRQVPTHEKYYTPEELELVIRESELAGALSAESGHLLREIFHFGELTAAQVMAPRVHVIGLAVGSTPAEIEDVLARSPHTRYPMYELDLDHLIGMVHVKDLLRIILAHRPLDRTDARAMPTVPETASLDVVLAVMRKERTQMAAVVDEYGGTAGIVTLQDLFDEVVGRIADEPAPGAAEFRRDDEGRLRVPGTARLDEVGERLQVELRHDEVTSVSGLVLMQLGRPPRIGDRVRHGGVLFEVVATERYGVAECAVTPE